MELPSRLAEIVAEIAAVPRDIVLEMLVDYGDALPELPPELAGHAGMEPVPECQSPLFLAARVEPDGTVSAWFDSPPEAPTSRGFAGILAEGLTGATAAEVLAVPADLYERLGLAGVVSPLRIRGASAVLARLQRQVREQLASAEVST